MTVVNSNMLKSKFSNGVPKHKYMIGLSEHQVGLYIKNLIIYKIIEDRYKTADELAKSKLDRLFFIRRDTNNNFDIRHWLIFKEDTPHGKLKKAANSLTSLLPLVGDSDPYQLEIDDMFLIFLKEKVNGYIETVTSREKKRRKK